MVALSSLCHCSCAQDTADVGVQFPELMGDLLLPMFFGEDKFFSSVLRVGSPGVKLWTHYDVGRVGKGRSGEMGSHLPYLLYLD